MATRVIGYGRFLEPAEIERLESAGGADRLVDAPFHVGIDHQRKAFAEVLAHGADALDVFGQVLAADLHFDGAKSLAEIVVGLAEQIVERQVEIDAAGIAGYARIIAAEELPERQVGAPRLEVPERHVES